MPTLFTTSLDTARLTAQACLRCIQQHGGRRGQDPIFQLALACFASVRSTRQPIATDLHSVAAASTNDANCHRTTDFPVRRTAELLETRDGLNGLKSPSHTD